jgi:[acyl-carrier-protein] S-malonyltransferase
MRAGLFPGQGIPAKTVLEALDENDLLLEAADEELGFGLRKKVEISARRKGATLPTALAQPAIFVAGVIAYRRAESKGSSWDFFAGHSLGEYAALVAAGSLDYLDALRAVAVRGEAMEAAGKSSPGGMAAVLGLDDEAVGEIAGKSGVTVANHNAPGQVVLSGPDEGLARAAGLARSQGARSVLLQVSGAFHSPAIAPAAPALKETLARIDIKAPRVPVISNVTAGPYESPDEIRELLLGQLTSPVRFRQSLDWLWAQGVRDYDDLGPGRVVAGLAHKTFAAHERMEVAAHV